MTNPVTVRTSIDRARTLARMIDNAYDGNANGEQPRRPSGNLSPVIVAEASEVPTEDPEGFVNPRTLRQLNGATWEDTGQSLPVRRLTNGRQIAVPVGLHGFCVRDDAFWAVNVGTSAAPTITVSAGVISGMSSSGVAAVLKTRSDGKLEVTDDRLTYSRLDDGGSIEDGTLIQLAYVSGNLTCVHANCGPTTGLTGLEATPE